MELEFNLESVERLISMIKSDDHDNLVMAMTILFNLSDELADVKATKIELYQLVIDVHSWGKFIELYKNNINDIDDLVVTTNNKKEGFFESKSISSKQIDYPDVDVNNANNYLSKINFNENQSNNNGINII
jgi:hypothetical protein